jgi:hypothetical protein
MKRFLTMLPLLLVAGGAGAIERHNASQMTCEELQSTLMSEERAIVRTPSSSVPGMMRYDIYVADESACTMPPNGAVWASVKTADGKSCPVFRCVQITRNTARSR